MLQKASSLEVGNSKVGLIMSSCNPFLPSLGFRVKVILYHLHCSETRAILTFSFCISKPLTKQVKELVPPYSLE